MPHLPHLPILPTPRRWGLALFAGLIAVVALVVWFGPRLLGRTSGTAPLPVAVSALDTQQLDQLSRSFTTWQSLWQDRRFSELQSVPALVPAVPGNVTPFTRPVEAGQP